MIDSSFKPRDLVTSLRCALAEAGVATGDRIQPERDLARTLGVSHARLRRAIRLMVEDGTLVQRQGSGTFVKRPPSEEDVGAPPSGLRLEPQQVLHQPRAGASRHAAAPAVALDLRVWWESLSRATAAQQSVLAGMSARAEALGHRLALHSVHPADVDPSLSKTQLADRFLAMACDGLLLSAFASKTLMRAAQRARVPVMFFATASCDDAPHPAIVLDTQAGMEIAFSKMSGAGCRRLAAVILHEHNAPAIEPRYRAALALCDADPGGICFAPRDPFAASRAIAQLFADPEERPDGLFVGDDHLVPPADDALSRLGLEPGRHVAVVAHGNRGATEPAAPGWSRVEYDTAAFGRLAVSRLVSGIRGEPELTGQLTVQPAWVPGDTHVPHARLLD